MITVHSGGDNVLPSLQIRKQRQATKRSGRSQIQIQVSDPKPYALISSNIKK